MLDDVEIRLDLDKMTHHPCALNPHGRRLLDREIANSETSECGVSAEMATGLALVAVDSLHSNWVLPVTGAQATGSDNAYLPDLSMRRPADRHSGSTKPDARHATFTPLRPDADPRANSGRNGAEGGMPNITLVCMTRRKFSVLFALVRDHKRYTPVYPQSPN